MTDIVNAKVVEEERPTWPRYIVQAMFSDGFCQHGVAGDIQTAMKVRNRVSKLPARIIDTAPEPGSGTPAEVRELVVAARELLVTHPRGQHDRRLATALKPFEEVK